MMLYFSEFVTFWVCLFNYKWSVLSEHKQMYYRWASSFSFYCPQSCPAFETSLEDKSKSNFEDLDHLLELHECFRCYGIASRPWAMQLTLAVTVRKHGRFLLTQVKDRKTSQVALWNLVFLVVLTCKKIIQCSFLFSFLLNFYSGI